MRGQERLYDSLASEGVSAWEACDGYCSLRNLLCI